MSDGVATRIHARLLDDPSTAGDRERVAALVRQEAPLASRDEERDLVDGVLAAVVGLGPLEPLLRDASISDVLVNGDGSVWIERSGELVRTDVLVDRAVTLRLIERIVAPLGLRADRSSPLVDARLPDGSRCHAVLPPLAVDGPCVAIRRFSARPVELCEFAPPDIVDYLVAATRQRRTIVVSGGTGAGKTTLLNALAGLLGTDRVVTIEDAAELRLPLPHVVRLESRPANGEGAGAVTIRDLVRAALRMRPDRIVVGEVRGSEAFDLLQALNTGHVGSLTTCHANGPADALRRLETLALMAEVGLPLAAVRQQLAAAVDVVVHVARGEGGRRRIVAVAEVDHEARVDDGVGLRPVAGVDGLLCAR